MLPLVPTFNQSKFSERNKIIGGQELEEKIEDLEFWDFVDGDVLHRR